MPTPENETAPQSSPENQAQPENGWGSRPSEAGSAGNQVFDPESLEQMCRHDLPAALRLLADHLEQKEISGSLWNFQGNGMVQDWRREHFLMTLDLAVLTPGEGK